MQVAELVHYLQKQFAPEKPEWADLSSTISRIRQSVGDTPAFRK
jgi:nicotinate dehydrogenase subunit B